MTQEKSGGFSLVEMLIVIGIIVLVAGIAAWSFSGSVGPRRVRNAAALITAYLDAARSEAMKQQVFPYLLRQEGASASTTMPRYWPFHLHAYTWTDEDGTTRYAVTVQATDVSGGVPLPSPSDSDPNDHSYDLYPLVELPPGVVLKDAATGSVLNLGPTERPVFWREEGRDFVTGSVVGADNGIVVADAYNEDVKITIKIDPVYGTVTVRDETR